MTESEAKLIESMEDDYSNVLKEAKSMGCKEIRALYNIPLKNMELIINALKKQIPKKPMFNGTNWYRCVNGCEIHKKQFEKDWYCPKCGQKLDWSVEE